MSTSTPAVAFVNKLKGKTILIIGGSSGIGFGVAQACLAFGASVIISSSSQSKVDNAIERLGGKGDQITGYTVDLLIRAGGIKALESRIEELLLKKIAKPIDHYVHTAGDAPDFRPLIEVDLERAQHAFDVRYWAPYVTSKLLMKHKILAEGGSITLTSGTAGLKPPPGWSQYAGLLNGISGLVRSLATDIAPLRCNVVCPGPVETEMWEGASEVLDSFRKKILVSKVASAQDASEAYLYCMRDSNMTGQTVVSEGGSLLK